ncbi:MAG TPA: hypothetical protein ENK47_07605 [Euryarchaeota archaeon]|nr:hypothetical protein [Euryarchaeota archaeon]
MKGSLTILLHLSAFLILLMPTGTPLGADGLRTRQAINMVEIDITETSISIDTSFNGSSEGKLHCSARLLLNLGLFVDSVDLHLEVRYPDEISASLSEYDFTLTPSEPLAEFTANITVHPGTSSTVTPEVVIGGTATAQPSGTKGGVIEDSASIIILPFYTAEISFKEDSASIPKGEKKVFTLNIENRGNADETFILNWANENELKGAHLGVEFETAEVLIPEGGTVEVEVTVTTSSRTSRGSYIIRIETWSEKNGPSNKEESNAVIVVDVTDPYLGTIQGFLSASPFMVYLFIALTVMAAGAIVYLLLRVRANIAWKRRLRRYREMGEDRGQPETPSNEAFHEGAVLER